MIVWLYYFFNFRHTKSGQCSQHIKIYMCETNKYRPQNIQYGWETWAVSQWESWDHDEWFLNDEHFLLSCKCGYHSNC